MFIWIEVIRIYMKTIPICILLLSTIISCASLSEAVRDNDIPKVKQIVDRGGNVNEVDEYGETALMVAVSRENLELVKILIDAKADVEARNKYESTVLMTAALAGNLEIVSMLLKAGANPNAKNKYNTSALLNAVSSSGPSAKIVRILIEAGAHLNVRDERGTALDVACKRGHDESARLLVEAEAKAAGSNGDANGYCKKIRSEVADKIAVDNANAEKLAKQTAERRRAAEKENPPSINPTSPRVKQRVCRNVVTGYGKTGGAIGHEECVYE